MKKFKNTSFSDKYDPSFEEFVTSHKNVIAKEDLPAAFEAVSGKAATAAQIKSIDSIIKKDAEAKKTEDGDATAATGAK